MKVICIDATGLLPDAKNIMGCRRFILVENEVYEPISEISMKGDDYYLIHETFEAQYWYSKRRFIPLSDIDETELVNKKLETA